MHHDILFSKNIDNNDWRIVIPSNIVKELKIATHEKLGHLGVYNTFHYLTKYYYWIYMQRDIKRYTLACDMCQRVKHLTIAMEGGFQLIENDGPHHLAPLGPSDLAQFAHH